jgi:hypothetical protein
LAREPRDLSLSMRSLSPSLEILDIMTEKLKGGVHFWPARLEFVYAKPLNKSRDFGHINFRKGSITGLDAACQSKSSQLRTFASIIIIIIDVLFSPFGGCRRDA